MFCLGSECSDALRHFRSRSGEEKIRRAGEKRGRNACNLFRIFALAENDFRHSVPYRPVVIHLREAQIFERHVPQTVNCGLHCCLAIANLLEKLLKPPCVHVFLGMVSLRW